jgi:hypothetical protein
MMGVCSAVSVPAQDVFLPWPYDVALREDALTLLRSLPASCSPLVFVTLVTSVSRPPILLTAIEKILKRKYAGAVNLDTVVDLLSPDS